MKEKNKWRKHFERTGEQKEDGTKREKQLKRPQTQKNQPEQILKRVRKAFS